MKSKTISIIIIILSCLVTLLWVLGLIFANINLFILAMCVLLITAFPTIKYFNQINEFFRKRNGKVIEDERTENIEAKASLPGFASIMVVSIYSVVAIFTLRNIYPEYVNFAYPFLIITVIGFVSYIISQMYFKRKYSA